MNGPALLAAYGTLKSGSLWSSTGKCRGFAVANPGEAAAIDAYVNALAAGSNPTPPVLSTATGKGIVGMLAAMAEEPLVVRIIVPAQQGDALTAVIA